MSQNQFQAGPSLGDFLEGGELISEFADFAVGEFLEDKSFKASCWSRSRLAQMACSGLVRQGHLGTILSILVDVFRRMKAVFSISFD